MGLKITYCTASPSAINLSFSDALNAAATDPLNYTLTDIAGSTPGIAFAKPLQYSEAVRQVTGDLNKAVATGTWLSILVDKSHVTSATGGTFDPGGNAIAVQVNGESPSISEQTRAVEDAVTYPVLTEEVAYGATPASRAGGAGGAPSGGSLGQVVSKALGDVLGWKVRNDDPKGFVGALTSSFTGSEVEGRTEFSWTPRTYAVQTDLAGGITGAQASIYSRAQVALDKSLPLLDGLCALDTEADPEDVTALKAIVQSQLNELVNELGEAGGPRLFRVDQYFGLLLGAPDPADPDPDAIGGSLGNVRDKLGLKLADDFVNTVDDEQNLSNFRILADYVTSLAKSWVANRKYFELDTDSPFLGTRLVLLSRQLSVVSESVDEVRFALDSVFIGPAERQTLRLDVGAGKSPLFAEDVLRLVQDFSSREGPRIIEAGGKLGIKDNFLPVTRELAQIVEAVLQRNRHGTLPRGFHTARVRRALQELHGQLKELDKLAARLGRDSVQDPPPKALINAVQVAEAVEQRSSTPALVAVPPVIDLGPAPASQRAMVVDLTSETNYQNLQSTVEPPDAFTVQEQHPIDESGRNRGFSFLVQFNPPAKVDVNGKLRLVATTATGGTAAVVIELHGVCSGHYRPHMGSSHP